MRLLKHYNVNVLHCIERHIFNRRPEWLPFLALWYGQNSQEDDMRFVHGRFWEQLWDQCWKCFGDTSKEQRSSLVKSIGYSKIKVDATKSIMASQL